MKLRGRYDSKITYQPGDVVVGEDGYAYRLRTPCTSGVPPVDTAYWQRLDPTLSICARWVVESQEELKSAPKAATVKGAKSK